MNRWSRRMYCAVAFAAMIASLGCDDSAPRSVSDAGQSAPIRFTEAAREVGIDFVSNYRDGDVDRISETVGGGAAWLDVDNDGDWDVYITTGKGRPNALYRNDDGRFTNVAASAGVAHEGWSMGVAAADYDGDGRTDLFVTNYGETDVLFHNNGDGTFTDVTETAGVGGDPSDWGASAAWADVDSDGDLDLYVARYIAFTDADAAGEIYPAERTMEPVTLVPDPYAAQSNALFQNNGDGTFTDITARARVADKGGKGLGVVFGDYDNDGDLDLFVGNDVTSNAFFKNRGDGVFEDAGFLTGLDDRRQGMGVDFGDADDDGDLDLIVTYWQNEMNGHFRNNTIRSDSAPTDSFDDIASETGLGATSLGLTGWGVAFEDFDNDGDLDLFIANGYTSPSADDPTVCAPQRAQIYRNDGGNFIELTDALAYDDWGSGRGLATADYDNDGDVDVLIVQNNGQVLLFRNDNGNRRGWVKARAPVGARLRARIGSREFIREVKAGSSFLSTNAPEILIGLPPGGIVKRIEMDGDPARLENVESGAVVTFPIRRDRP